MILLIILLLFSLLKSGFTAIVTIIRKGDDILNAAAYARYSSDNQREESIDAQVRAIKEYAQRNGYEIVKVYADEARSATTSNRPHSFKWSMIVH